MPSCAIKWCRKTSNTSSYMKDGITFHSSFIPEGYRVLFIPKFSGKLKFPHDATMKEIWISATHRGNFVPNKQSVLCSRHFTSDCFEKLKNNRRRLYESSVPTLYLADLRPTDSNFERLPILIPKPITITNEDPLGCTNSRVDNTGKVLFVNYEPELKTELTKKYNIDDITIKNELEDIEVEFSNTEINESIKNVIESVPENTKQDQIIVKEIPFDKTQIIQLNTIRENEYKTTIQNLQETVNKQNETIEYQNLIIKKLADDNRTKGKKISDLLEKYKELHKKLSLAKSYIEINKLIKETKLEE